MSDPNVWNAIPLAVLILDGQDGIVDANGPAEGFFNRSVRALIGRPIQDLISLEPGISEATARVRRTNAPLTLHETSLAVGPAPPIRCEVHLGPAGEGTILMLAPRDISRRVDRARASRTAAQSAIGMAEMLAHEIKNPLAGITGAAQLLSMNVDPEDIELTDLIVAESRRIVKLLEQVEQFGNLRPPERKAINIHDILDRARKSAMVGFASHMRISEEYDPSLPMTIGDPDQLLQVFLNILKNAAQVSPQDGQILIRTFYELSLRVRRPDGTGGAVPLQVEIVDDGPGVPPEIVGSLFEPFVSGRENGTGLGLALVSKIIADHDGWISVDSKPGRTAVRVSLPFAT
jgi:two-component system nitrogen regulation sensor histidine kinase GlnL